VPTASAAALDFRIADLPTRPDEARVLMTSPDYFEIAYVINAHMEGMQGSVDRAAARRQWEALKAAYERIGYPVDVLPGQPGLPDMVFCANQTLPVVSRDGSRHVVLSQMGTPERAPEVPFYRAWFADRGYQTHTLPPLATGFEGMGDALWHPGRRLVWGGWGFRTDARAYDALDDLLDARVCALELRDPLFYHLDTCLSLLDEQTALYVPSAFTDEGRVLIAALIPNLIEADEHEARTLLAGNAHCPDRTHVLIQSGCDVTNGRLRAAGFAVVEVDTSEFLKSGGSVFCMKQMIGARA
jgi:N-dimethylarginine dimethylaminohydrolase